MFLNYFVFLVPSSIVYLQRFLGSSYIHAHCFCLVGLISGPGSVGAGLAECSMSRMSSVSKKKISWETLSATSRRGAPTLRRQNYISLPRRDVDLHVATSNFHLSVTSRRGFTRRDVIFDPFLPRRDVDVHVATSIGTGLCHVATWPRTSRRRLVICSVTSRRDPERRDVVLFTLCDVATSPRTSRRDPVFSLRMVHFGPSPYTASLIGTLAPLCTNPHRTCRSFHPTGRRSSVLTDHQCSPLSRPFLPVLSHSGISTTMYSTLAWV